jgi:hypothetical protein
VVGGRPQEDAAFADQEFQMNFERLSIQKHHRASAPIRSGALIPFQFADEGPGRILERPSILMNLDIATAVPGFPRASASGLRTWKAGDGCLFHRGADSNFNSVTTMLSMAHATETGPYPVHEIERCLHASYTYTAADTWDDYW